MSTARSNPSIETNGDTGASVVPAMRSSSAGEQCALVQGHALGSKQKLGRSEHKRVVTAIERIAQDYVDKLIEKQRRRLAGAAAHERKIRGFDRRIGQQVVAPGDQQLIILARIGVRDSGDLRARHGPARLPSSVACRVRSTTQASGGGVSSGRAR